MNLDGYALPVKKLKGTDPVETLDLSGKDLGVASVVVIASLISVNGGLTVIDLLYNKLDAEAAKMLAEVAKQKGVSLCGIQRDQTTADFRNKGLKLPDAILLASDLSQAVVTGALTSVDLRANKLRDEGWGAIFAAICGNKDSKIMCLDASSETIGPAGVKLIAEALRTSVTGALTKIDVSWNFFGPEGAKVFADALRVNGALTHLSLVGNETLGDEGVEALSVAIEQSKSLRTLDLSSDSECRPCSKRVSTMFGPKGATALAKALTINSSLTQIEYAGSMNAALWAPSYNVCFLVFVPAGCRATTLESRVPRRSRTPCTSTARSGRYVSLSAHTRLTPLS